MMMINRRTPNKFTNIKTIDAHGRSVMWYPYVIRFRNVLENMIFLENRCISVSATFKIYGDQSHWV